ncbi:MAG: class I SAM-dependent methyltransferase [Planctomycetota bacterium]|jgi:SAM-dependent methyltransferase
MKKYDRRYFADHRAVALASARALVPHLLQLVRPRSVVDVGCGVGAWLSVFGEHGVSELLGVDGDHVPRDQLMIPPSSFLARDLSGALRLDRTFDLALSLEVAEHLPAGSAETFVDTLAGLAPVVVFSAAIPLQGGTGHVNERWQTYWAGLFAARGFVAVDALRPGLWDDERIAWWYRQNTIVYVGQDRLDDEPALGEARRRTSDRMLDVVHPALLATRNRKPLRPFPQAVVLRSWIRAGRRAVRGT